MTKVIEPAPLNPPNKEESMAFYTDNEPITENKSIYVDCSCGAEVLKIEYDEEIDSYYFGVFHMNGERSWKNKWKQIWHIIRYGEPYSDNMVLRSKDTDAIIEFIDQINKEKHG